MWDKLFKEVQFADTMLVLNTRINFMYTNLNMFLSLNYCDYLYILYQYKLNEYNSNTRNPRMF